MDLKMERFLTSLGLDPSRFDLSFIHCGWKGNTHDCVYMEILKDRPWTGEEWAVFEEGLSHINYGYELHFRYGAQPTLDELSSFLADWCLYSYRVNPPFRLEETPSGLFACLNAGEKESEAKKIFDSFSDLMSFMGYSLSLSFATEKENVEPSYPPEPPIVKPSPSKAREAVSQEEEEESEESRYLRDEQETNSYEASMASITEDYVRGMKEERAIMSSRKARRKGDYHHLDDISVIESMDSGNVEFVGEVYSAEIRPSKRGDFLLLGVGEGHGAVSVRATTSLSGMSSDDMKAFQIGDRVLVKGAVTISQFNFEHQVAAHAIEKTDPKPLRTDDEPVKRAELHVHTKMSAMDGTGDIEDYCKAAEAMGMSALAVTDHGCLQSFPAAERAGKVHNLKIIYGCEFYMFDWPVYAMRPNDVLLEKGRYCVFDFETTGLSQRNDRVTEFGAKLIVNGQEVDSAQFFVNAGVEIPPKIAAKTGITNEMIKAHGISEEEAIKRIEKFMEGTTLVSHNAPFDVGFLNEMRRRHGYAPIDNPVVDTLAISYYLFPDAGRHNLGALSRALGLSVYNDEEAHRADFDAGALNEVWFSIIARLQEGGKKLTLRDLANLPVEERGIYKHLKTYHVVALAKNQEGLKALYRLVSDSSTTYLATGAVSMPKIPRFELERERGNLLLGSACFNGDVFVSASEKTAEDLAKAISFYDYIEIQPKENYRYLVEIGDMSKARLDETVEFIYKEARKQGKLIVATGDAHYVNPSDKVTRDVYISSLGLGSTPHPLFPRFRARLPYFPNPDQHLRTTKEMLDCFREWLPEEEAREVVVNNSLKIEATAAQAAAQIAIQANGKNVRNGGTVTLTASELNPITVTVNQGNATRVYTLNITGAAAG